MQQRARLLSTGVTSGHTASGSLSCNPTAAALSCNPTGAAMGSTPEHWCHQRAHVLWVFAMQSLWESLTGFRSTHVYASLESGTSEASKMGGVRSGTVKLTPVAAACLRGGSCQQGHHFSLADSSTMVAKKSWCMPAGRPVPGLVP